MTKKFLVPLLVAPLILSGCGNGKKALKPFERGENILNADLIRLIVGENEEHKLSISESKFAAPEGWKAPSANADAIAAGFDVWEEGDTQHVVSLFLDKEVASVKVDASLIDADFESLVATYHGTPMLPLHFGYAWSLTQSGEGENIVYNYKAVDAFGNALLDWSGKDTDLIPTMVPVLYFESMEALMAGELAVLLEYTTWHENHYERTYKVYSDDYKALEDVAYLPESGDPVVYSKFEFEKDGKTYYNASNGTTMEIYEENEKGDKLVYSFDYPKHEAFYAFSEYHYISVVDRVVPADSEEFTYVVDEAFLAEFQGQGDTEGDFSGSVSLPVGKEKHLQEVHIYDMYNFKDTVVASPYYIEDFGTLGFEELDIDEELLPDPYVFIASLYDVDAEGNIDVDDNGIGSHYFLVDENFGLHDELNYAQIYALNGYLLPFGDGYIDAEDGIIYDELLNRKARMATSYFEIALDAYDYPLLTSDHAVVVTDDLDGTEMYALMDTDGKLATGFFADIEIVDDTHFLVEDVDGTEGYLDLNSGITWVDNSKKSTDGVFTYLKKGEGENIKYDAYYDGVFFKEVASDDLCSLALYGFNVPTVSGLMSGSSVSRVGVPTLREGTTDVYDIVWYTIAA